MLAYNYPLLNLFWSILIFFGFFLWIWLLITVFIDIFRSPDLSGISKALWVLVVLFLPLIGILIYLIVRGHKMQEHAVQAAKEQDEAMQEYVRRAAGTESSADQLSKLVDLRDRGVISPEEFEQQKQKILT